MQDGSDSSEQRLSPGDSSNSSSTPSSTYSGGSSNTPSPRSGAAASPAAIAAGRIQDSGSADVVGGSSGNRSLHLLPVGGGGGMGGAEDLDLGVPNIDSLHVLPTGAPAFAKSLKNK